ncbi:MAG: DUF4270 domain-containing protein [Prolixibacteraceae bacterium]|nr:DUF4270 domain-containing protein [Prolixibacteraceae bacterium]
MKKKILNIILVISGLVVGLVVFDGCSEENTLGMNLLPSTDLISVKNTVLKDEFSSYTFSEDSVRTDGAEKNLLGSLNDPVFGITTIDFATQFRLQSFPDFGTNPVADSIKLYLYYRIIYGDTVTSQRFRVYELEEPLDVDAAYYQNIDLKSMSGSQLLGDIEYVPKVKQDTVTLDTFYQLLVIPLDISLADKLVHADSAQMVNNDLFLDFFKGLYIESEAQAETGGTILTLEAASSSNFQGSALLLYYNNDENKTASTPDTLSMPYIISKFSARVNRFTHNYSGTPFEANLNTENGADSLIFIQATGGLQSKITIDDLSYWQDSTNTAINKAELVFQIDTVASDIHHFAPPTQMLFTVVDSTGSEFLPIDYVFSSSFYGGKLNSDYTYRFNITQHLQEMIDGNAKNYGFFLTAAKKNSEAKRVVLKGANSTTGIKLIVTYSKFLQ